MVLADGGVLKGDPRHRKSCAICRRVDSRRLAMTGGMMTGEVRWFALNLAL